MPGFNQKLYLLIVRIDRGRVLRWQERGSSSSAEFLGPGISIDPSYRRCAASIEDLRSAA